MWRAEFLDRIARPRPAAWVAGWTAQTGASASIGGIATKLAVLAAYAAVLLALATWHLRRVLTAA